jgi:formylglycine-generating enzyme required for sulfatase activity
MGTNPMNIRNKTLSLIILIAAIVLSSSPAASQAEEVTIMLPGDVPMVLVKIPAGTFMMGSPPGERGNFFNNEFQHQVTLTKDYYMGKTRRVAVTTALDRTTRCIV